MLLKPGSSWLRGVQWLVLTSGGLAGQASSVLQDRCHYPALRCSLTRGSVVPFFASGGRHSPDTPGCFLVVSLPAGHNNPFSYVLPHRCAAVMCSGRGSLCGFLSDTNWVLLLREVDLDTDGAWKLDEMSFVLHTGKKHSK